MWRAIYLTNVKFAMCSAVYYRWAAFHKNPAIWRFAVKFHSPFINLHGWLCQFSGYRDEVNLGKKAGMEQR